MPIALVIVILAIALVLAYLFAIRPWQVRWGATDEEASRSMAGDEIVEKPTFNATRSVTVNARPENIWPWVLQIGITRAGWYSYDWIDNLGRHSAEVIIPQFQNLKPGDIVPMSPDGKMGLWVKEMEPPNWMLWWDKKGATTWCWGLCPANESQTRLITRIRMKYNWLSPEILADLAIDIGDIIMMRKCMLGIKRRAEKLYEQKGGSLA